MIALLLCGLFLAFVLGMIGYFKLLSLNDKPLPDDEVTRAVLEMCRVKFKEMRDAKYGNVRTGA